MVAERFVLVLKACSNINPIMTSLIGSADYFDIRHSSILAELSVCVEANNPPPLQNRAYLTYDSVWVVAHALRSVMHDDHMEINPPILDFWSTPVRHYNEGKMLLHYLLEVPSAN